MTDTNTTTKHKQPKAETNGEEATATGSRATTKLNEARDAASDYAQRAAEAIEANPMSVVVGGLAAGLVAGALIPRSERERATLAPLGQKLSDGAHAAIQAARETGKAQLTASLLSPDAAKESARTVFDSAVQAVKGGQQAGASQGTAGGAQENQPASDQGAPAGGSIGATA